MAAHSTYNVVEERERTTVKFGHFLQPSHISNTLPPRPSQPTTFLMNNPIRVDFGGWRNPQKGWVEWVEEMESRFRPVWERAGIYQSVLNSKFSIVKYENLVISFAEKWSPQTQSFIFSWGECSVTLEDVMSVGGYSILGDCVFCSSPVAYQTTVDKLKQVHLDITRSSLKKVTHSAWISRLKNKQDHNNIQHEAFLALWLSRFVFPSVKDVVHPSLFGMACHLARGNRIALAPAVLSTIYRDLRRLKNAIITCNQGDQGSPSKIFAPLQILQIWIWERFSLVRPLQFEMVPNNQPRFKQWAKRKLEYLDRRNLDSLTREANFLWRPYPMHSNPTAYELESFARCVRVSRLVSLDGIEDYLPHRVARQFGFDQDIPGNVIELVNLEFEVAWADYTRPIDIGTFFVPPPQRKGYVTKRYREWWKPVSLPYHYEGLVPPGFEGVRRGISHNECSTSGNEQDGSTSQRDAEINNINLKFREEYLRRLEKYATPVILTPQAI